MTRVLLLMLLITAPAAAQPQPQSPSFDCTRASGEVELLICKDARLAALDRRMAAVYTTAMKTWPADVTSTQRAYQRGWISGRNECWKSDDVRSCVEREYKTRIVELQISSGQVMVPQPVGYVCTGGDDKPFLVTFYKETDPASAVITYGDDQVIAFLTPSDSGSRYTTANVEFWEHHDEASISWFGTALTCRPRG